MDATRAQRVSVCLENLTREVQSLQARAAQAAARADALSPPRPGSPPQLKLSDSETAAVFGQRGGLRAHFGPRSGAAGVAPISTLPTKRKLVDPADVEVSQWWCSAAFSSGKQLLCPSDEGCHLVARPWSRPLGDFAAEEFLSLTSLFGGSVVTFVQSRHAFLDLPLHLPLPRLSLFSPHVMPSPPFPVCATLHPQSRSPLLPVAATLFGPPSTFPFPIFLFCTLLPIHLPSTCPSNQVPK
jgi:hypothetical protein